MIENPIPKNLLPLEIQRKNTSKEILQNENSFEKRKKKCVKKFQD